MKHIREIAVFLFLLILALAAAVRSADAASEIPVCGPAAVGFEDDDLRRETIIPAGVLVVTPEEPNRLWIGDGVTKGGLEVRAKPCVTGFVDVAVATTNLAMGLWPVTFGDWAVRGGENAFGVMRGGNYKFYITYTGETTYAKYLFGMDGDVYTFTCNSVQGAQSPPWLLMTTNLLEDFQRVETGLEYVDSVTARLVWTNDTSADTLFFRVVTDRFEEEALVATVPIHADAGITMGANTWTEWPDVDGKVAAVVADHTNNSNNPHKVKFWQVHEADEEGMRDEFGMSFSRCDGISSLSGFGRVIDVETGTVEGDWHFDERPTLGTNGFATTNDVAAALDAVEERVGAVEGMLEEYWCKWTDATLSATEINWIPTNWPARTVWCYCYITFTTNDTVTFRLPAWTPDNDCTLHLVLLRPANHAAMRIETANGTAFRTVSNTSSATYNDTVFCWRAEIGQWIASPVYMAAVPYAIPPAGSRVNIATSALPEDSRFAPVHAQQTLSTPSLQSLRPSLSPSAPLALDADIDDSDLAIDAAPDALDSDESDDLEDEPEEDTP